LVNDLYNTEGKKEIIKKSRKKRREELRHETNGHSKRIKTVEFREV